MKKNCTFVNHQILTLYMRTDLIAQLLLMAGLAVAQHGIAQQQVNVFDTDVAGGQYYRIPAIVQLHDGQLLAIADDRHGSDYDIGGNWGIDIVGKTSMDGGKTWSDPIMIADGDGLRAGFHDSHGDAAAVADRETGQILIMCASGKQSFLSSTLQEPLRVGRYTSNDGGLTWTESDATSDIYGIFADSPEVNGIFFSSGRICQSRRIKQGDYYRIYSAIDAPMGVGCLVLYSDDLGQSWHALGGPAARPTIAPWGDESKVEELPDGNVLLSCRSKRLDTSGRLFNIYDYASGTWGTMATSNEVGTGTYSENCSCNGELLIVPVVRTSDQRTMHLALQSVPRGKGRQRVGIYYKPLMDSSDYDEPDDFSWGWKCYQVTGNYSAYSTMIATMDGDIAFFLEDCNDNPGTTAYDLIYQTLTIETITSGRYSAKNNDHGQQEDTSACGSAARCDR
ncbi:MAG: exo-alpha-sialidase [Muribaculaceae bacterium]|nr:exo-alpha-sialidase [Muribaculaceae bacterium]